jgi:hypothetical protein
MDFIPLLSSSAAFFDLDFSVLVGVIDLKYASIKVVMAIAAATQTTGVSVRIKRTMTPAKYDPKKAYKI